MKTELVERERSKSVRNSRLLIEHQMLDAMKILDATSPDGEYEAMGGKSSVRMRILPIQGQG